MKDFKKIHELEHKLFLLNKRMFKLEKKKRDEWVEELNKLHETD